MNLDEIPDHASVLIDANILIYAANRRSPQCVRFLARCGEEKFSSIIPTHILAETMHVLMLEEARENNWATGANPARILSQQPERIMMLHRYESAIRELIASVTHIEPVFEQDYTAALALQRTTGLLTNDALFAATAQRLRVDAIASADSAFKRLADVSLYLPDDLAH
jgi:predicted nucleic acid-binding protein